MPQIRSYARVGLNTFYTYFRNKEQLLNEIYRDLRCRLIDVLDLALKDEDNPRQQFHELWMQMVTFDCEYPNAIGFLEHRHHGAYLDEMSRALERIPQPVVDLIERLRRERAIKNASPMVLAAVVWGTFVELLKLNSQGRISLSPETLQSAEDSLWDAIQAPSSNSDANEASRGGHV